MGLLEVTKEQNTAPGPATGSQSLPRAIAASASAVDSALEAILPRPHGPQGRVQEAMRYATFAGGKRLRPFLVLHSAACSGWRTATV